MHAGSKATERSGEHTLSMYAHNAVVMESSAQEYLLAKMHETVTQKTYHINENP
jgi:hypothetical protein